MARKLEPVVPICLDHIMRVEKVNHQPQHITTGERCDSQYFSINQVTYNLMQLFAYWSQFPSTR